MSWINQGTRLVMCKQKADSTYWSDHWRTISFDGLVAWTRKEDILGSTFTLSKAFRRFLPRKGKIIEGGCGLGQWVKVLKEWGYDIEGVDFSKETIETVKEYDPTLPVNVGDVLKLPYPKDYFTGYISLGVVEHFEEGPERALKEAYRVLGDEGILCVSVPYYNPIRQFKSVLGFYKKKKDGEFYQYAFTKQEFSRILEDCGFIIVSTIPYDTVKGLKDESAIFRWLYHSLGEKMAKNTIKSVINGGGTKDEQERAPLALKKLLGKLIQFYLLRYLIAHMILFIAKAKKTK